MINTSIQGMGVCLTPSSLSPSTYYIDEDGDTIGLYGTGSLDILLSSKLPHIKALSLQYIDIKDILKMLPQLKDALPNAKVC